ncbi:hypothetical protein KQ51_00141 [Candidatus Izimaplasma bacterium HR1]|uniref:hypothetical protein n=1 Tax=Candidatus Izimoplasma sp. HR1 TaxID=1541959 RepID=UPI0004F93651|nr:hypothetical protein KQ51_00141 [Candidatus Izimaplasma bacterium HR1]
MKLLTKIYFYAFPLVLIPFMFLLYYGNIYLYNIYTLILLLIFIINGLLLKKEEILESFEMYSISIQKYKKFRIFVLVVFIVIYLILFIRFVLNEFIAGMGGV